MASLTITRATNKQTGLQFYFATRFRGGRHEFTCDCKATIRRWFCSLPEAREAAISSQTILTWTE